MKRLLLALLVVLSAPALRARSSAHGGDLERDQDNVWFLGDEVVHYCIERDPAYPLDAAAADGVVREALKQWNAFFVKYGMNTAKFTGLPDGTARGLALRFEKAEKCADPVHQLRFLFGVTEDLVRLHRPEESHSLGVAIRHGFDYVDYRTGGVIWVRDFGADARRVRHVVLHELGHVFGMKHDTVWVMNSEVASILTNLKTWNDSAIGEIESPVWKYLLRDQDEIEFTYRGDIDRASGLRMISTERLGTARRLLGLQGPAHSLKLRFEPRFDPTDPELPLRTKYFTLVVQSAGGAPRSYSGKFEAMVTQEAGPGLYGAWLDGQGKRVFRRKGLIQAQFADPASGYFEINGTKIPAVIKYEKGPILGLFVTDRFGKAEWWWTSHYEAAFAELRRRER